MIFKQKLTFLILFNLFLLSYSEMCDYIIVDNSTVKIFVESNYTFHLRLKNISEPLRISATSSWYRLYMSENTFDITDDADEAIMLYSELPYIYTIEVTCTDRFQHSSRVSSIRVEVAKSSGEAAFTKIFGLAINVLLAIAMLALGCELEFLIIWSYLKKPIGPSIGICCQFIGMPVISYVVGYILLSEFPVARFGLLLIGCSPGGASSNFFTVLFGGDSNLSVTMTFCSSIASFGLTTFWVYVLGSTILTDENGDAYSIPYLQLFLSLLSFIVPLCIGVFINYKWPTTGKRISTYSRPVFALLLLVSAGVGIYINRSFFELVGWRDVLSGMLLGLCGYIIGFAIAFLARLNREQIIAVSIETAIQNPSVAFVVLQTNLQSPYSDIGLLPVISFMFLATGPPLITIFLIMKAFTTIRNRSKTKDVEGDLPGPHQIIEVETANMPAATYNSTCRDNPGFQ